MSDRYGEWIKTENAENVQDIRCRFCGYNVGDMAAWMMHTPHASGFVEIRELPSGDRKGAVCADCIQEFGRREPVMLYEPVKCFLCKTYTTKVRFSREHWACNDCWESLSEIAPWE